MNGNYLLDTNIIIALFDNEPIVILHLQESLNFLVPSVVVGELFSGAYNSMRKKENIEKINKLVNDLNIVDCDARTGNYYGQIKKELNEAGTPIPENDIWIAALARQYNLALVSRDKHFNKVKDIVLESWEQ